MVNSLFKYVDTSIAQLVLAHQSFRFSPFSALNDPMEMTFNYLLFDRAAVRSFAMRAVMLRIQKNENYWQIVSELSTHDIHPTIFIEPLSEGGSGRYRRP